MTQEQVNDALRGYRTLMGRCGHIDTEIARLQQAIQAERDRYVREMAAPPTVRLDGMPRSVSVSSPTEHLALSVSDGTVPEGSEAHEKIRQLEAQIERLRAERNERELLVQYVDSWLNGLPERERWVIERHIIDGEIWHDIIAQFNTRFDDAVSRDRLKRIQQRALDRIYAMAV